MDWGKMELHFSSDAEERWKDGVLGEFWRIGGRGSAVSLPRGRFVVQILERLSFASSTRQLLSHRMYLLVCFRKSSHPQNCQLDTSISNRKQSVDDFLGELTSSNHWIDTLCEINFVHPSPFPGGGVARGEPRGPAQLRRTLPGKGLFRIETIKIYKLDPRKFTTRNDLD